MTIRSLLPPAENVCMYSGGHSFIYLFLKWQGAARTFCADIRWNAGLDLAMLCTEKERVSHDGTQS